MSKAKRILEAKDLKLFKRLLRILGSYSDKMPATGVDRLFNAAVANGAKVLPKDKRALAILDEILDEKCVADSVQKLLNMRFACLHPLALQPRAKKGRRHEVAFWCRGGQVYDRCKDLIDWDVKGGSTFWSDMNGEKVELIDDLEEKE